MAKRYHATKKFARIAALHEEGAPASMIRKFSDSWIKRSNGTVQGFHKAQKPGAVTVTKGAHHVGS